jgi:hypothetical protein
MWKMSLGKVPTQQECVDSGAGVANLPSIAIGQPRTRVTGGT